MAPDKNMLNYVKGLTGYQIKTVFEFAFGEKPLKSLWSQEKKTYIFYVADKLFKNEKTKKLLNYFSKFWLIDIKKISEY
jgi:hypothetical protein